MGYETQGFDSERLTLILEGLVTTQNSDGSVNIAPMGPIVDLPIRRMKLRPFKTATTYHNLKRVGRGVFHITDDSLMIARTAVRRLISSPPLFPAEKIDGDVIANCCRWYEFTVTHLDDSADRTEIEVEIEHEGKLREFVGFHRARHAVIEAAILATRVDLLPSSEIATEFARLKVIVDKTAGDEERTAFRELEQFVSEFGVETSVDSEGPETEIADWAVRPIS